MASMPHLQSFAFSSCAIYKNAAPLADIYWGRINVCRWGRTAAVVGWTREHASGTSAARRAMVLFEVADVGACPNPGGIQCE